MRSFLIMALVAVLAIPVLAAPRPMPKLEEYLLLRESQCLFMKDGTATAMRVVTYSRRPLDFDWLNETPPDDAVFEWDIIFVVERTGDGAASMEWIFGRESAPGSHNHGVRRSRTAPWALFDSFDAAKKVMDEVFVDSEWKVFVYCH